VTADPQETFAVDYPCDQHCLVEVDLTGVHQSFTHRQMRVAADAEHAKRHEPAPVPTPILEQVAARHSVAAPFLAPPGR
jgi:hypothetical protein